MGIKNTITKEIIQRVVVGVIVALILSILQNLWTGFPIKRLWIFDNHKIVDISSRYPSLFKISNIKTYHNRFLNVGDKFSYKSIMPFRHTDIPLSISGSTTYSINSYIWVVCRDRYGGYYIQTPRVHIRNNQAKEWVIDNVRPLEDMSLINFILVDETANNFFRQREISEAWGRFPDLPDKSEEIASIRLERYFDK